MEKLNRIAQRVRDLGPGHGLNISGPKDSKFGWDIPGWNVSIWDEVKMHIALLQSAPTLDEALDKLCEALDTKERDNQREAEVQAVLW